MSSSPEPPGPVLGPCQSWIDGDAVAACCAVPEGGSEVLDVVAVEASMALFEISGRQFTGLCSRTVRPCSSGRGACFDWGGVYRWEGLGWWRSDETPSGCGCAPLERVKLSGYPVREIVEVKIDGAVVDPATYRLDGWRDLIRLDDPGPPPERRAWPACQNLALPDTEAGTFSVEYRHGVDPPELGRAAAAAVACELYRSCSDENCKLPQGTTGFTRQGVTVERGLLADWLDPTRPTGIPQIDLFLAAYAGSKKRGRRPAVWSPDVQPYAKEVGV